MSTVLVVEDDYSTRLLTVANLHRDFDVVSAEDGKSALDVIYSRHIDVIVSDIMMPGMDGYQLAREVRSSGNNVPFIFLTAKASPQDKAQGFELGIDDYMVKPIDYSELI